MRRAPRGRLVAGAALIAVLVFAPAAFGKPFKAVWPAAAGMHKLEVWERDSFEADDTSLTAKALLPGTEVSFHSFDTPTDEDWTRIHADSAGTPFVLEAVPWDGKDIDTVITVWGSVEADSQVPLSMRAQQAFTPLATNDDSDTWPNTFGSTLFFTAPAAGDYFVQVSQADPGNQGEYYLYESKGIAGRIGGRTRFDTAADVSHRMWQMNQLPNVGVGIGPGCVVVANGLNYPDALTGGVFASLNGTSMLLTSQNVLPYASLNEIRRLATNAYWDSASKFTVYIVGGEPAVGKGVEDMIKDIPEVDEVVRIAGPDRYATAAEVATSVAGLSGSDTAFIVTGENFADALAAGPVAAANGSPVLLTRKDSLPQSVADWLVNNGITTIHFIGSPSAVATSVLDAAAALPTTPTVDRIGGEDRYQTARLVAQFGVDEYDMDPGSLLLASGENFPDGLSCAPLSAWTGGPMLLTRRQQLSDEVGTFISDNGPMTSASYLVGGRSAVDDDVYHQFQALGWAGP